MTDPEIQQLLKERFQTLPKIIQDVITSGDIKTELTAITSENHLHMDQAGGLQMAVMMILLGVEPMSDFVKVIEEESKVSHETANAIAERLNTKVFAPMREHLQALSEGMSEASETSEASEAPHAPPSNTVTPSSAASPNTAGNTPPTTQPETPTPPASETSPTNATPATPSPIVHEAQKPSDPYHEPVE